MRGKLVALTLVLGMTACGDSDRANEGAGPATKTEAETALKIVASDFAFDLGGIESVPAGEIRLTLENRGKESHEAQLYLLNEGVAYEEFVAAAAEGTTTDLPPDAADMATPGRGVTSNVDPGDTITVPASVEPGTYAFVCHLLDRKSLSPHFTLGMMAPLRVG